jgi:C-terminal processing protease CtpA/Prc
MKNSIFLVVLALIFTSCKKLVLGDEPQNNPNAVFETLWTDFDEHYSLFEVRGTNWNSLKKVYQSQVNITTSKTLLWSVLSNLIENLDDSHTVLYDENDSKFYISGYKYNEQSKLEFDKSLVISNYLDYHKEIATEKKLSYGKVKNKDIGYIYLGAEAGENPNKIDEIIDTLKNHKAIILDMRQNIGGDDKYGKRIAGVFADNEKLVFTSQTRNGKGHNDFDSPTKYYSKKQGDEQFLKPVIVLTDRRTISAGEVTLLYLKTYNQVIQIGDTTAGDFSDVSNRKFLPNGWSYQYSIKKYLLPNGKSLDGIGHIPDVYVKNTQADMVAKNDKVIEKAIDYLWKTYGIK